MAGQRRHTQTKFTRNNPRRGARSNRRHSARNSQSKAESLLRCYTSVNGTGDFSVHAQGREPASDARRLSNRMKAWRGADDVRIRQRARWVATRATQYIFSLVVLGFRCLLERRGGGLLPLGRECPSRCCRWILVHRHFLCVEHVRTIGFRTCKVPSVVWSNHKRTTPCPGLSSASRGGGATNRAQALPDVVTFIYWAASFILDDLATPNGIPRFSYGYAALLSALILAAVASTGGRFAPAARAVHDSYLKSLSNAEKLVLLCWALYVLCWLQFMCSLGFIIALGTPWLVVVVIGCSPLFAGVLFAFAIMRALPIGTSDRVPIQTSVG